MLDDFIHFGAIIRAELVDFTHCNPNRSYQFLSTYCVPSTVFTDFMNEEPSV